MISIVRPICFGSFHQKDLTMNSPSPRLLRLSAFTLIELLVVISIIAILMGLLFPAIGLIKETARKAQSKTEVSGIVAAVKQYQTEYGKFPPIEETASDTTKDAIAGEPDIGAKADNADLMNVLRGIPEGINESPKNRFNPKVVVFLEGKAASDPKAPKGGFAGQNAQKKGCFFDPWGKQYNIVLDSNYDNEIDMTQAYKDFQGKDQPRVTCGAFALGKDNLLGSKKNPGYYKKDNEPSDDVVSWQ